MKKRLTAIERIAVLRGRGFTVDIQHRRRYVWNGPKSVLAARNTRDVVLGWAATNGRWVMSDRGGKTQVSIESKSMSVVGLAFCRDDDAYSKTLGVEIALGRAEAEIERALYRLAAGSGAATLNGDAPESTLTAPAPIPLLTAAVRPTAATGPSGRTGS